MLRAPAAHTGERLQRDPQHTLLRDRQVRVDTHILIRPGGNHLIVLSPQLHLAPRRTEIHGQQRLVEVIHKPVVARLRILLEVRRRHHHEIRDAVLVQVARRLRMHPTLRHKVIHAPALLPQLLRPYSDAQAQQTQTNQTLSHITQDLLQHPPAGTSG